MGLQDSLKKIKHSFDPEKKYCTQQKNPEKNIMYIHTAENNILHNLEGKKIQSFPVHPPQISNGHWLAIFVGLGSIPWLSIVA